MPLSRMTQEKFFYIEIVTVEKCSTLITKYGLRTQKLKEAELEIKTKRYTRNKLFLEEDISP